jgi:ketosteroid isomerase-like protein
MPHANAQQLRAMYNGVGQGDLDPLIASLADDVLWIDSTLGPLAGEFTGKDGVLGFFGKMMGIYGDTFRLEITAILADDDRGVVLTSEAGTSSRGSLAWSGVHLWTFRDGRCTRFQTFMDETYNHFWAQRQVALGTPGEDLGN